MANIVTDRMMVQLELVSDGRHLVAWVRNDRKLEIGNLISLKDHEEPTRLWEVVSIGVPQPASAIKRGWDNNI